VKKIVILQSNYIPWKGYFDLIKSADEFIFYDEVQYTKNDWRNRNKIKSQMGLHWLTIPVKQDFLAQRILDTKVVDDKWKKKHFQTIRQYYSKAACFASEIEFIEELYSTCVTDSISKINYHFISQIAERLGITTKLSWSQDYGLVDGKTERLVDLVKKAGGTKYISGLAAKDYLDETLFDAAGIEVIWADYSGYPEYPQIHPPFAHGVSIIDLLLNTGNKAGIYLKKLL
jgi:hypothetical protein